MKSYTSNTFQLRTIWQDACTKYRLFSNHDRVVADKLRDIHMVESCVREATGMELIGKQILEIGPGQQRLQMAYLSTRNEILGIDLDVIASGANPLLYLKMAWSNGLIRTAKTASRKLLGVDRNIQRELGRQLGIPTFPALSVKQMDVSDLTFRDASFDGVYCRSVLQHVPKPELALRQMARVLREGGVAYASIHLYTSQMGHLDPRVFDPEKRASVQGWPHLRPKLANSVRPTAYLNHLRLPEWKLIFEREMPGVQFQLNGGTGLAEMEREVRQLQSKGELLDYSLEELVYSELVAIWKRPQSTPPTSRDHYLAKPAPID
jgi:SAM-dependent methyltransferase